MNKKSFKKVLTYIFWQKEAVYKRLDQKSWNKMYKDLIHKGGKQATSKTLRKDFNDYDYRIRKKGSYCYLYTYNRFDGYMVYTTNPDDDAKNFRSPEERGKTAFNMVDEKFKELHDGMTIRKAYGYSPIEIKRCIPKSFYYTNERYLGTLLPSVSACDFCSQYPSSGCGPLPDWNTATVHPGTVAPTEEYPFAFYMKSGHIAEYNNFDTHNWLDTFFYKALFRWEEGKIDSFNSKIKPEEDETVLCKASPYRMDDVWEFYYKKRNVDPAAKLVMNATIGYMHLKSYKERRLGHVAAVIIARANNKMLNLANRIGHRFVCHIVIDGIIYIGDRVFGGNEKALNKLYQEWNDVECYIRGANAYVIQDHNGKILEIKHGSYDTTADGKEISIENTKSYKDIELWHRAEGITIREEDYCEEEV